MLVLLLVQREAFESVRFAGGHCVVIGGAPHGSHVAVSPGDLLCGKRISGCLYGCYNFRNDLPQLVRKGPPRGPPPQVGLGERKGCITDMSFTDRRLTRPRPDGFPLTTSCRTTSGSTRSRRLSRWPSRAKGTWPCSATLLGPPV